MVSKRRKTKVTLWAAALIIIFAVIPYVIITAIPEHIKESMFIMLNVESNTLILNFCLFGVLLAAFALLRGYYRVGTYPSLIAGIGSPIVWFYATTYVLSLQEPWKFGRVHLRHPGKEGSMMSIFVDVRIVVLLVGIAAALAISSKIVEFVGARKEREKKAKEEQETE